MILVKRSIKNLRKGGLKDGEVKNSTDGKIKAIILNDRTVAMMEVGDKKVRLGQCDMLGNESQMCLKIDDIKKLFQAFVK